MNAQQIEVLNLIAMDLPSPAGLFNLIDMTELNQVEWLVSNDYLHLERYENTFKPSLWHEEITTVNYYWTPTDKGYAALNGDEE